MNQTYLFKATLSHDKGKVNITVCADSEDSVIQQIMKAENCPVNSFLKIKKLKKVG